MDDETWQHHGELCWPRSCSSRNYDRFVPYDMAVTRSKAPIWRILWRRIKKEKKRMFPSCSNSSMKFTYDPYSYSQNFDRGLMCADADDLSRSFSARFAVSSRFSEKNSLMI